MRWTQIDERPLTKSERQKVHKWGKLQHGAVKAYTHAEILQQYAIWVAQAKRQEMLKQAEETQRLEQERAWRDDSVEI